ncbi:MAG: MMPL family transporter [Christiangramia sp.]|uniref:MMPL family transporter n=1 Tax=Christiangramia sp. TaxID=1931228 RepID=UPI0032422A6D
MHNAFYNIYRFFRSRPLLGIGILLVYLVLIALAAWNIRFEEDVTALVPKGEEQIRLKKILQETDFSDKMILSVSAENNSVSPDSLAAFADSLTSRLETDFQPYIKSIKGKIPDEDITGIYDFIYENLPIFLNDSDYVKMETNLDKDSIAKAIGSGYRSLLSPTGFVTKNYFFKDPLNYTNLGLRKLRELQVGDNFGLYNNYLITSDRKHIILFLDPVFPSSETANNQVFIEKLDHTLEKIQANFPGVRADYFGGVLYSIANANQIKKDIGLTLGIALSVLFVLLILFYRKFYIPLILFLPSLLAGISAIAVLSIFRGSVSAISLGIGAILLGISLDYALHILTHFRNNNDVKDLFRDITRPIIMSSFTTAIAFLCLLFVNSDALTDLGIFASVSVLLSSVFSLVLIPLLYRPSEKILEKPTVIDRLSAIDYSRFRAALGMLMLLFLVSLFFFQKVEFNEDLAELNYSTEEIRNREKQVQQLAERDGKTIYLVSYAGSVDEALTYNNELYHQLQSLKQEQKITNFSSIGGVVLSTSVQNERIKHWSDFWTDPKKDTLQSLLLSESAKYGFKAQSFDRFYAELASDFEPIGLQEYKQAGTLYLSDFISEGNNFATVTSTVNLPEENSEDFIQLFQDDPNIYPIDRKAINQNFLGSLKDNFNLLIGFSVLAVFLILLAFYRNIEISILTLLPIAITWVCALGIMGIMGLHFNILNIIISTFIFGLGLDYSIFMTNACLKEYETGKFALPTYQTSILLSVITTLLGMGALIFARHPALRSVASISIIGVLLAMLISFVLQRFIFRKLLLNASEKGKPAFAFLRFYQTDSKAEKLYRKNAVLNNYRYKTVYSEAKKEYRNDREKYLRISQNLEGERSLAIINAGIGVLALFLKMKQADREITALEQDIAKLQVCRELPAKGTIQFTSDLEELSGKQAYILQGDFEPEESLKLLLRKNASKVIFLDSEFPNRWLLDLNFEISYRQNGILIFRKIS